MKKSKYSLKFIIYLTVAAIAAVLIIYLSLTKIQTGSQSPVKVQRESYRLGTIVRITLYGNDGVKLDKALGGAMDEIERLENLLSVNIASSDVSLVNRASGNYPVKVSEETGFLIGKALEWSKRTGGAFDPTVGGIVKLWGIGTKKAGIPEPVLLQQALSLTDFRKVLVIHEKSGTFIKTAKGQRIDLGGIAKGYVTDKVKELLVKEGVSSALIDLGGNIAVMGSSPKSGKWKLGLQHPFMPRGEYFGIAEVSDVSVVTSGPYERYFELDGVKYHHIFDPTTGYPSQSDLNSVTIISENSTDADALSTALFVMGLDKSVSFLHKLKNIEAVLVAKKPQGTIVYVTQNFRKAFVLKDPDMKIETALQ